MMLRPKLFSGAGISFKFLLISPLATVIVFGVLLTWFWNLQNEHIMEQVRKQAIILFKQISMTRHWCSEHNGILVQKSDRLDSNPYLKDPDVVSQGGIVYTKITPSILTTLLSEKARNSDLFWFKLTSDLYLNPKNAPDDIERKALEIFRNNPYEGIFQTDLVNGKPTLRYLAPVVVTSDCIQCHSDQYNKLGSVGGCLSVFVPMDEAQLAIRKNTVLVFGGGMGLALSLVGVLYLVSASLVFNRIKEINKAIQKIVASDGIPEGKQKGDELKEISDFCYTLDNQLKSKRDELEARIKEATRDLSFTKERLERANQELEDLNKAKTAFFSDISHELRTPLTAIKGASDIISRKSTLDSSHYLEIIKRNTDHLTKLVLDFLDYSKIENGQIDLDIRESSVQDLIEAAIRSFELEASRKKLTITFEGTEIKSFFDSTRIFQVMTNLLSNAIRFSPNNGVIMIKSRIKDEKFVEISFQDQGPGIPVKHQENVFNKFYLVKDEKFASYQKGSSGIGLAICKGLVEAHGGRIWVENATNNGAIFLFEIPLRPSK